MSKTAQFVFFVKLTAAAQFYELESEKMAVASECKTEANANWPFVLFFPVVTISKPKSDSIFPSNDRKSHEKIKNKMGQSPLFPFCTRK